MGKGILQPSDRWETGWTRVHFLVYMDVEPGNVSVLTAMSKYVGEHTEDRKELGIGM